MYFCRVIKQKQHAMKFHDVDPNIQIVAIIQPTLVQLVTIDGYHLTFIPMSELQTHVRIEVAIQDWLDVAATYGDHGYNLVKAIRLDWAWPNELQGCNEAELERLQACIAYQLAHKRSITQFFQTRK
jgi:hypothetical protein